MLVSEKNVIEGARVLRSIGTIKVVSACRAAGYAPANWRERALRTLILRAEDIDADAIIGLDYRVEPIEGRDEHGVQMERVYATGIAVRLALAA